MRIESQNIKCSRKGLHCWYTWWLATFWDTIYSSIEVADAFHSLKIVLSAVPLGGLVGYQKLFFLFFFFLFLDFAFCWVFLCLNTRHLALGCSLGQEAKLFVFPRELPATWGYDSVTSPPRHPDPERGPDLAGSIFFLALELLENCIIA